MKKIMFFVGSMHSGGAERVASLLCNHWAHQSHDVTLIATYSQRGDCHYKLHSKVKMVYLSDVAKTKSRSLFGVLRRLITLRRMIVAEKPDMVFSRLTHVNIMVLLATLNIDFSLTVSECTYPPGYPLSFLMHFARKYLYPCAERVVMQTHEGLAWLEAEIPRSKGVVIHNPLCLPLGKTEPIVPPGSILNEHQRLILAVGRLDEAKGFDLLIRAFQKVGTKIDDVQLVILGEGPLLGHLRSLADGCECRKKIHLVGRAGNLQDWYDRASLFVSTSRLEGFPNALLEAIGVGIPAVALDCKAGPRELISTIDQGLLLELNSTPEELCAAILNMLNQEQDISARVAQAKHITTRYSVKKIACQWLAI